MRKIERIFINYTSILSKLGDAIGLYSILRMRTKNKVLILMYHGITKKHNPVSNFDGKHVAKETFEKQLLYLKKHYTIIPLDDVILWKQQKKELPTNAVVLTFDDGYRNCYTTLYPILKEHNVPATIFLPTSSIRDEEEKEEEKKEKNRSKIAWYDIVPFCIDATKKQKIDIDGKEYSLKNEKEKIVAILEIKVRIRDNAHIRKRIIEEVEEQTEIKASECTNEDFLFISWKECKEMQNNGISFGSHTITHQVLTHQKKEEVHKELKDSKATIEKHIQKECTTVAYPFGNNNKETREITKECGYIAGLTTEYGYNTKETDNMALQRITVSNKSSLSLFTLTLLCNFPKIHHSMYLLYGKMKGLFIS
jgi:peptidoglycan/xylan/chitin deacetylase (PgdA/CDA1 family)